jgi:hypothetical protein
MVLLDESVVGSADYTPTSKIVRSHLGKVKALVPPMATPFAREGELSSPTRGSNEN